ncbi:unnamed protein product [Arctia plantaginis]|uniref:Uncharacterized protein n=1 Tax=Arctia plantaginis TaxID=874455 RepID=A0A8S1ASI3_ARCPL|nr:unnamed protein product [Arctia plantaginis]
MRPLFVLCFIIVFYIHDGQANVDDFFSQVGQAFRITWASVVDAIKRPVRNKRIGPGLKRKALRDMTTHLPYIWSSPKDSEQFLNDISRKSANDIKVTLPLLLHPKYKAIREWINSENEKISSPTEQTGRRYTVDDDLATTETEKNEPENMKLALPPEGLTLNLMVKSRNTHTPIANLKFDVYEHDKKVVLSLSQEPSRTALPPRDNRNVTYPTNCPKGYIRIGASCTKNDFED